MKVEVKGLERTLREIDSLRRKLRLKSGEFADIAARTVRDTVTRNAQPFGSGKKALEAGRNALRGDLFRVFKPVPDKLAGRRGVIVSKAEAKRYHRSRRGRNGRTTRGERRKIVVSVFRAYFEDASAKVGMAKGSLTGGDDSRLKGRFAKWVKRWSGAGSSKRRKSPGGAVWKFSADPRHVADGRVMGRRGVDRVMRNKERNLRNVLRRTLKREMKKSERRVNRKL